MKKTIWMLTAIACLSTFAFRVSAADSGFSFSETQYSWCLDATKLSKDEVNKVYSAASKMVEQNKEDFVNSDSFYYKAYYKNDLKLLLILSQHDWKRGTFDVSSAARSIINEAESLTIENDGMLPKNFTEQDWSRYELQLSNEKFSDVAPYFSDAEIKMLEKIFLPWLKINSRQLLSMSTNVIMGDLQSLAIPGCDNRVANVLIGAENGNDYRLAVDFFSRNKKVYAATSFFDEVYERHKREAAMNFGPAIKQFIHLYGQRDANVAAELIANINERPGITAAIEFGGGYSAEAYQTISTLLVKIVTNSERENRLYSAVKKRLSEPGIHVIAYGGLHFMGKNGIIERLRAEGATVTELRR